MSKNPDWVCASCRGGNHVGCDWFNLDLSSRCTCECPPVTIRQIVKV